MGTTYAFDGVLCLGSSVAGSTVADVRVEQAPGSTTRLTRPVEGPPTLGIPVDPEGGVRRGLRGPGRGAGLRSRLLVTAGRTGELEAGRVRCASRTDPAGSSAAPSCWSRRSPSTPRRPGRTTARGLTTRTGDVQDHPYGLCRPGRRPSMPVHATPAHRTPHRPRRRPPRLDDVVSLTVVLAGLVAVQLPSASAQSPRPPSGSGGSGAAGRRARRTPPRQLAGPRPAPAPDPVVRAAVAPAPVPAPAADLCSGTGWEQRRGEAALASLRVVPSAPVSRSPSSPRRAATWG